MESDAADVGVAEAVVAGSSDFMPSAIHNGVPIISARKTAPRTPMTTRRRGNGVGWDVPHTVPQDGHKGCVTDRGHLVPQLSQPTVASCGSAERFQLLGAIAALVVAAASTT